MSEWRERWITFSVDYFVLQGMFFIINNFYFLVFDSFVLIFCKYFNIFNCCFLCQDIGGFFLTHVENHLNSLCIFCLYWVRHNIYFNVNLARLMHSLLTQVMALFFQRRAGTLMMTMLTRVNKVAWLASVAFCPNYKP